jgi:actin-related protein 10
VTKLERGQQIQKIRSDASSVSGLSSFLKRSVPSVSYPIGDDAILDIDGTVRESACEVMFEQDKDRLSVSTMVLDALLASPIDTRRALAKNLVIVGGTSMLVGFKTRLIEELWHLLNTEKAYQEKLHIEEVSKFSMLLSLSILRTFQILVHRLPCQATYASWTGASLFGATDAITTRSFTRDAYMKEGGKQVPDWSNLRFNSITAGETRQG